MPKHFRNLSPAQSAVFERIATGQPPRAGQQTLAALERLGLVTSFDEVVGRDALGYIVVTSYEVPTPVHMEWCAWCAANPPAEEENET